MTNGRTQPQTGIITRSYKHGSIVYFEGDKSEYIYILKSGGIILTSIKIDTGEEDKEKIKIGEFFGVKSSLGKYPREETAQTVGETVLLILTLADFEKLILRKVELVMKMLRVFSNQLRRIGKMVREVLGETDTINPEIELFKIGEYYYKIGKFQQASYSFKRYMEYYPDTKFSNVAMKRIRSIESGEAESDIEPEFDIEKPDDMSVQEEQDVDLTDFSLDEESDSEGEAGDEFDIDTGSKNKSSITGEMDDFFSDEDTDSLEDFTFDEPQSGKTEEKEDDITKMFYNGVSQFSQENYNEALTLYSKIMNLKSLKNDSEKKIYEKTHLEIGRCYIKLGDYQEALNSLSSTIKKFPNSDIIKNSLFHIGLAYEMTKKTDIAASYYNKVIVMEPNDSISKLAIKKLKTIQNQR